MPRATPRCGPISSDEHRCNEARANCGNDYRSNEYLEHFVNAQSDADRERAGRVMRRMLQMSKLDVGERQTAYEGEQGQ